MYVSINTRNGKEREEMKKFWNDVNECLVEIGRGSRILSNGDMNGRVGNSKVAGLVRKCGIDMMNENDEYLVCTYS